MKSRLIFVLALLAPLPCLAEGRGGDRMPAGGAFNSSFAEPPYAAPARFPAVGRAGVRQVDVPGIADATWASQRRRSARHR